MRSLFGEHIDAMGYYWLEEFELAGIPLVVSRTGWSSELGDELYLRDSSNRFLCSTRNPYNGAALFSSFH
jgi:hypothetical protein